MWTPKILHPNPKIDYYTTPRNVVADMVTRFAPTGRILDPCRGQNGVFLEYLPNAFSCEIQEPWCTDFFQHREQYDWIIGNPPWSQTVAWLRHTLTLTTNFLYLLPLGKIWHSYSFARTLHAWGGLKTCRHYGGGRLHGFPTGFAVAVYHGQRDYTGPMYTEFSPLTPPIR